MKYRIPQSAFDEEAIEDAMDDAFLTGITVFDWRLQRDRHAWKAVVFYGRANHSIVNRRRLDIKLQPSWITRIPRFETVEYRIALELYRLAETRKNIAVFVPRGGPNCETMRRFVWKARPFFDEADPIPTETCVPNFQIAKYWALAPHIVTGKVQLAA